MKVIFLFIMFINHIHFLFPFTTSFQNKRKVFNLIQMFPKSKSTD